MALSEGRQGFSTIECYSFEKLSVVSDSHFELAQVEQFKHLTKPNQLSIFIEGD